MTKAITALLAIAPLLGAPTPVRTQTFPAKPVTNSQAYPFRPIKIIVRYTAGSPNDVMARLVAHDLQSRLGQPVIIDNKPGGGTSIGTKTAESRILIATHFYFRCPA